MVFASETFLFLFLPAFLALYYLAPVRARSLVILAGSYLFYAWWRVDFLLLLIGTTAWAYVTALQIDRHEGRARRVWVGIGIAGCLGVLGLFKYFNFFLDSFAALAGTDAAGLGIHWRIILPIGISFYVFQAVSYQIDVYRRDVDEIPSFTDFAAFIALFPQLVAGPILRFKDLADQFRSRAHSVEIFSEGMTRFTIGLAKKVILADTIAPIANAAFATPDPSAPVAWLGAVAYMLQLYFDFAGYSDMAIGLGLMMGFRFAENFNLPYISRSITEFWRRWHISLSVWLRDYLYIPLGGNRKGPARTYVNLLAVMVLGGLWHGAAWTFVLWGAWHGAWLAVERATGLARSTSWGALLRTLLVVLLGWVLFRSSDLAEAGRMLAAMAGLGPGGVALGTLPQGVTRESLVYLTLALAVTLAEPFWRARNPLAPQPMALPGRDGALAAVAMPSLLTIGIGAMAVMKLAEASFSPFLYFQF